MYFLLSTLFTWLHVREVGGWMKLKDKGKVKVRGQSQKGSAYQMMKIFTRGDLFYEFKNYCQDTRSYTAVLLLLKTKTRKTTIDN